MRLLFLGAGAVGGYFGGRMAAAGADITFLVRPARAEQLAQGLRIESPLGDATVPVRTIVEGAPADAFDVIVLTSKAYGLAGALETIAPHVRPGTVIAPLLNGFAHIAAIEARFPEATVWGGVAQIPATLAEDGTVRHMAKLAGLVFGPRPGQEATRPLAERLVAIAEGAGITARLGTMIEQDLWDKWVYLATLAAGTCLMEADVGTILATDSGERFLLGLLAECMAVAEAADHRPGDKHLAGYRAQLTDRSSAWTASMLRDMTAGGRTEADHIIGDMIRRAEAAGIAVPLLRTAYTRLQIHEARRAEG